MKPLKYRKGTGLILMVVIIIIMMLLTGSIAMRVMQPIVGQLVGESVMCDAFCAMQSTVQEVGMIDVIQAPGRQRSALILGGATAAGFAIGAWGAGGAAAILAAGAASAGVGLVVAGAILAAWYLLDRAGRDDEDVARDLAVDLLVRPEGMGCYCGVDAERGKYLHSYTRDDGTIGEFHFTTENPGNHLRNKIIDTDGEIIFDHSGGHSACRGPASALAGSYDELSIYEGCIVVSVMEGGDSCVLWGFEEGSMIQNEEGKTMREMGNVKDYTGIGTFDPVRDIAIGDEVEMRGDGRHPSQRILLQTYADGKHSFELASPIACYSEKRGGMVIRRPLDEACEKYCHTHYDTEKIPYASRCVEDTDEDLSPLWTGLPDMIEYQPEGYDSVEELCPLEEDNDEDYGSPYCLCGPERHYYWEVYEE